jgi:hypothetical protein
MGKEEPPGCAVGMEVIAVKSYRPVLKNILPKNKKFAKSFLAVKF